MNIEMEFTANLPDAVVAMTGMPKFKAMLSAHIDAEAMSVNPDRSKYQGIIGAKVTDLQGVQTYITFNTKIQGETDEAPFDAEITFFRRAGAALDILMRSSPSATTQNSLNGIGLNGHGSITFGQPATTQSASH